MNRKISGEELQKYLHNALSAEPDAQGHLVIRRFTEKQLERYDVNGAQRNLNFMPACRASSNVTLEMVTDSSYVAFEHSWTPLANYPWEQFDLFVDGVLTDSRRLVKTTHRQMGFDLPEGLHHVQIWFPWNAEVTLDHVFVEDGAVLLPAPEKSHRILTFGDSITQGYIGTHPGFSYVGIMTRALNAECLNQAIGGYLFDGKTLDPALASWKPDLITVAYGTNDYTLEQTADGFARGVRGFVEGLTALFPQVPVLGIMPIYRADSRFAPRKFMRSYTHGDAMEMIRREYGRAPQVTVMEDDFFPHTDDCFGDDFLHPNDLGFMVYGNAVTNRLQQMGFHR